LLFYNSRATKISNTFSLKHAILFFHEQSLSFPFKNIPLRR